MASLDAIVEDLKSLTPERLEQAAAYGRGLVQRQPATGSDLRDLAGMWTDEEAEEIGRIIEQYCETVNPEDYDDPFGH